MTAPANFVDVLRAQILERLKLDEVDAAAMTADTQLFGGGLGLDSLDALEISVLIEEKYGIVIQVAEREKSVFGTIGGLARFVAANIGRDRPVTPEPGTR